jgi:nicotinate-nucleotide adenylyltransferase
MASKSETSAGAQNQKIGLLGGSFNPVHWGHLWLARDAIEAFGLDAVWLIPCAQPAHKPVAELAPAAQRLAMLEQAVAEDEALQVSRVELERPGVSYTVDTLRSLRAAHPGVDWHFIIGADTLPELPSWKAIDELLGLCRFITMRRPGMPDTATLQARIRLPEPWPRRLMEGLFEGHLIDVSSSEIRNRVAAGRSIRYLVPAAVETYIHEQGIYAAQPRNS